MTDRAFVEFLEEAGFHEDKIIVYVKDREEAKLEKYLTNSVDVLVIHDSDDPVYLFWLARDTGKLRDRAYVIFDDTERTTGWGDLSVYDGVMFGKVYLMVHDSITNPGVRPSQHGMYNT